MNEPKELVEIPIQSNNLSSLAASTPSEMINKASEYATALKKVIVERNLYTNIQGKNHVNIEGWSTLGTLLGVMPHVEWSRRCEGEDENDIAFESRVLLKTLDGKVVGSGEAMAARSENKSGKTPWAKNLFSIRSMAETRATGKAFRLSFAWIMKMAGYDGLPAEEASTEEKKTSDQTAFEKEKARVITHLSNSKNDSDLHAVVDLVGKYGLTEEFETKQKEINGSN